MDYENVIVTMENIVDLQDRSERKLRVGDLIQIPIPITDVLSPENDARRWAQAFGLSGLLDNN